MLFTSHNPLTITHFITYLVQSQYNLPIYASIHFYVILVFILYYHCLCLGDNAYAMISTALLINAYIAITGTASNIPVIPKNSPPTSTARIVATGCRLSLPSIILGEMKLLSICCISINTPATHATFNGDMVNAIAIAGLRRYRVQNRV